MEFLAAPEEIAGWIGRILRADIETVDGKFVFRLKRANIDRAFELDSHQIEQIIAHISTKQIFEATGIYDDYCYEVLVKEETTSVPIAARYRGDELLKRDEENKITYKFARPSDEYLVFLLSELIKIAPIRYFFDPVVYTSRMMHVIEREGDDITILNLIKSISSRLKTLRVESDKPRPIVDFVKFSNSFFFQLSYNLDAALVPQRFLDELVRTGRIARVRRTGIAELEAPKRFYIPDLVYHYQLAVASDSPPLQYLSFYHVAEHFFDSVFNDDLIERVKSKLTQPDFSYKRKKDVRSLIDEIGKSLKLRGESITFSEQEALKLTLIRYINVVVLLSKIREYDSSLVDYYKSTEVPFSLGDRFDLENPDPLKVLGLVANRIYKTRNAIVHSKEGNKGRYIPFEHDKVLVKEVPLLRFIAELIIIESSTIT